MDAGPTTHLVHGAAAETRSSLGRYEMLMVLAEATARPLAGESAERQAREAVRILDLGRPNPARQPTQAYHLRRAVCLERAGRRQGGPRRERAAAERVRP